MNPEGKELLRLAILRVLDANRTRFGLGVVAIAHLLSEFSFTANNFGGHEQFHVAVGEAVEYLADKGLIEEALKVISKENRAWRISRDGIAFVDERG